MSYSLYETDHDSFRESVRRFIARHVAPRIDEFAASKSIPRDLWTQAGEFGLFGLHIPEQYGGSLTEDYRYVAVIHEELSQVSAAAVNCFSIHYDVVVPYLTELGTEDQKARWLPGVCSGELITAIAMTEPSGGSDLASLKTTAVRKGAGWLLNGVKTFITNGNSADLVVVAARTNLESKGAKGISLFVVEDGTPGFARGRKLDKVGLDASDTAELFFDSVELSHENLLGQLDHGFIHMMERLPQERLASAVQNTAHARSVLSETLDYVKQRTAFGTPIGSMQHNKFLVADLHSRLRVTQAFVDQCVLARTRGQLQAIDTAIAKWWSAEVQNYVIDACVQLHGGYGFMNEYKVAQAWRDARVTKIWGGTNELMKELIGRDLGL